MTLPLNKDADGVPYLAYETVDPSAPVRDVIEEICAGLSEGDAAFLRRCYEPLTANGRNLRNLSAIAAEEGCSIAAVALRLKPLLWPARSLR